MDRLIALPSDELFVSGTRPGAEDRSQSPRLTPIRLLAAAKHWATTRE